MPYYDFDEEERRRREQEAIRDAYFQEWRRRNNSANAPKVKAADRREMAAANQKPVFYNGNVNPNNDQLPAMTTAEMEARRLAKWQEQVTPAANAAAAMVQNAPVDQYMMKRFLPNISDKSLEQTFAEAAKIDPNAKPAEPVKSVQVNPFTSGVDQAALIRDNLINPIRNIPNTPLQTSTALPDGGSRQPNYASRNPVIPQPSAEETYTPDEELEIADINVKTLPKNEQESLKSIAKKQQEAYQIPLFDASNIDNLDNYNVMLQKAEKEQEMVAERDEFQRRNNLTDKQMSNFLYYQQMLNDKEKNDKVRTDIRNSLHEGSGARQAGNALALNALSIMNSPYRGAQAIAGNVAQRVLGNRPDGFGIQTSGSPYDYQNFSQAVQEETGNRIAETGAGEVGRFLYNTGVSAAESAYNMALTGLAGTAIGGAVEGAEALKTAQQVLQNASLLPFGANAYASTYQEARQRGLDDRSAALTATVSGAAEIITEKVSLDSLWDMARGNKRFARNAIVNALAQAGIEGSEEVASDLINAVADRIINGDRSEYEQDVQSIMMQNGGDEADARRQATRNFIKDVGMSFLGGAISGGVMGGAATAVGAVRNQIGAQRTFSENTDFQTVADHIDDNESNYQNKSAAESAKVAKQTAQDLADKQANGEKVTRRDINKLYREISDAQQTESETIDEKNQKDRSNSLNMHDVVSRPTDEYIEQRTIDRYNAPDTKMTAEDVTKRMAQAETASELVSIRKQAENSSNESVRQAAQDAYEINQSRVMSQGETQEAFDAAENMMTTREAFNAGLEEQNVRDFDSAESRMAYNEGRMISMQRASRASIDEDLSNIEIGESKLSGKISGVGENAVALTNNGQVELSEITDKTVRQLYSNAASQNTEEAAQTYLDNYVTGMPVSWYNNAFDRYSVAGATGQDFNNLFNNETVATQWMNKDQLRAIYDYGQAEADQQKIADATRQNIAIAVRGTGRVIDNTNGFLKEQPSLNNLVGVMAKVTGKDYVINQEASDRINGYFNRAMQTVVLNANNRDNLMNTLFHEGFGEVMKAHNVEGYERVQQAIMDYLAEDYIPFAANVKHYQKLYQGVEGTKSLYDASSEMINDAIAGLFTTDEGIRDFSEWADKKYSPEEKKTVLQNIADFFQSLIDSFKDLLANGRLSDASRRTAEMGQKRAAEIRQMILAEMDVATANAEGLEVKEGAESENSYSVVDRNDEYNGGIRYSIDTTAEALNLTFEKDGNVTVLRDTDGRKITHMTPNMVRNTPLGGMINSGIKNGFISTQDAEKEYKFVSDLVNQMLQTQDLDMVFAVNSVIGFQQLPSGEREDWTKNPRKSKNAGYVSNSDPQYSTTVDFTTICVKSQAIIDAMSATMKKLGRGLTADEITKVVYKNTHDAGEPVPCPVCYVFSRWVGLGGLFDNMKRLQDKYADADTATIRKDMAELDKQIAEVQKELGGSKKTRGKAKDKLYAAIKEEIAPLEKVINAEKLGGKVLLSDEQRNRYNLLNKQIDLLNDWTWLEKVRLSKNYKAVPDDVLFDINAGTRFANEYPESWTYRTTRGPAMGKAATPYADEHIGQIVRGISSPSSMKNLGDLTKDPFLFSKQKGQPIESVVGGQLTPSASRMITNAIKKARVQNLLNGQRMQSTSDFRFEYALDYLTALYELQSVGAKVQMYTKVPESVGFLASAGAEMNLSLMPYENGYEMDENGNPVYDENGNLKLLFSDVTGMHPDDAFRLSSMYDNVQPIVVGTNDIFIRGLLADPRITFVIPYHASGSNETRYIDMMRAVGESVKNRQDYSLYQTDTVRNDATESQKAAADLRQAIVTGKAKTLSSAEKAVLSGNPVLHQLYQRFYGVDMNGNPARIENKYLDSADRGADGYGTVDHNTLNTFLTAAQSKTIMPYEFWDKTLTIDQADANGKAFQDYCESLGLYPRFTGYTNKGTYDAAHDFSNDPGYWKMLPDRAMYNRDGTYHEQQSINVSNMRMDYLDHAKTVEGIVKPSAENDRNKVEMIAQKSYEDINNGVRYSLNPVEPVQPSEGAKWYRGASYSEIKARFPYLFNTEDDAAAEESDTNDAEVESNNTQVPNTEGTYDKVFDILERRGFKGTILDASAGLGLGTLNGRERGLDVEDIEPYYDKSHWSTERNKDGSPKLNKDGTVKKKLIQGKYMVRKPKGEVPEGRYSPMYTDYSQLHKQYDFIINNAVINVLSQDQRDDLVVKLGEMLKPGGEMFINVRGRQEVDDMAIKADKKRAADGVAATPYDTQFIDKNNHEVYVGKGKTGSIQKGYSIDELKSYLDDALNRNGNYFTIEPAPSGVGGIAVWITKSADAPVSPEYDGTYTAEVPEGEKRGREVRYSLDTRETLKTLKGSSIKRSKYGVGKDIGGQLYFHKNYVNDLIQQGVIPQEVYDEAIELLPDDFEYNTIMYDYKAHPDRIRFDSAPNFDTAREPYPGNYMTVDTSTGEVKPGKNFQIWHHKWQWVKDDYEGFDVDESYDWSREWLQSITSPSGQIQKWNQALRDAGLPEDARENYADDVRFSLNDVDFTSMDMFDPYIEDDPYHEGVGSILEEGAKALGSTEVDPAIVRKIARNARSKYGSSYDLKTFQDNLEKVFAYARTTDGVDYNDLANLIREVAQPVIDEATEKVGQEEYDNFMNALRGRTVSLTPTQKKEVANVFGTYGNFRSQMRGIKVQDGAIPLDNVWSEIVDASGNVLKLEESEGNQPLALYDAIETLQPKVKNSFDGDNRQVAGDLAMEIIEQYFEAAGAKDAAQKMREQNKKYRKAIRDSYNEKLRNAKKEVRQGTAMRVKESIAVREQRKQIDKLAKDLYKWGTEPTKDHHIMNSMIQPIMDFLGAIDFVTPEIRVAKDGTYYANVYDYDTGKYPRITGSTVEEVRANVAEAIRGGKGSRANMKWSERMRGITELYDKVSKGEQFEHHDMDDLVHTLDRGLGEELNDLLKRNAGVLQVSNLNSDDLKTVKNVLRNIKHAVNVNNKAFTSQERMSDLASETMNSVNERSTRRERTKFGNKLFDFTVLDMATPKTYFKLANSEGVYKILRNALNKKISNVKAASEFMENLMEGVADTKNWDEVKTYKTAMGGTIQMTDKQVMSLYELSKRQQAMMHRPGGVTVTQIEVKKGLLKVQRNQTKPVHLTDADIANITSNLTDEQKRIADAMQQYMAVDCSNLGNEASRLMYGFDKFTDPNYFPIRIDRNSIGLKSGDISKLYNAIAEMGFTKAVKQNARNAIVIDDIFDVFTNHVSDMATYNAYAPAIADALRWYNYRTTDTDADQNFDYTESVQAAVQTMLGDRGKKYFENVIRNLNEQEQSAYIAGPWEGFTSKYKVAAVGANARVVIQQPTAIVRARNVMKDKYLLAGLSAAGNLKDATAHMKESSDIAWWKSQGYYESNIGKSMKRILTGEETAIDKLQDTSLALAGLADDLTWSVIYRGVELEQKDIFEKANKDINSDAYRKAVNDRFDEVIDATQVVDSTLHRSQYMRSADGLNKLQASFMAEPTKSYNMLLSAYIDAYRNSDGGALKAAASKTFAKAASTFVMTAVVNAAAQSLIDALRSARKKDDEDYWERWADAFEENVGDNVNPLKLMPWVKDMADAIDNAIDTLNGEYTYSTSSGRMDIEAVTNFIQQAASTIQYLKGESKKTAYGIMYQDIRALSQLTGIPVYNIMRDVSAVYDSIRHKYDELPDLFETSETNAKSSAKKRVFKTIDEGGDFKKALKYAEGKGNNLENFASQITSYYKPIYTELMETDPEEAAKMEERLEAVYKYLQELNGKDYKPRVYKWVEKPEIEQIELTGGTESSGSRMVDLTNVDSIDVPISDEPANIWGPAFTIRKPRGTSYWTSNSSDWEKTHHINAARMIQESFQHGYDAVHYQGGDFARNAQWHLEQINKRNYARKKTYGSGGGNAVAWKSPE